jgi:hypothetical protein
MNGENTDRGPVLTAIFWIIILSVPIVALLIGTGYIGYWTIPPFRVMAEGDPLFMFDAETGYLARPNGSTKWTALGADDKPPCNSTSTRTSAVRARPSPVRQVRTTSTSATQTAQVIPPALISDSSCAGEPP